MELLVHSLFNKGPRFSGTTLVDTRYFFLFSLFIILFFVLLDFSLTVKAATLIFISGCGSAISSAKEGKSGFIYNLVKS